MEDRATGGLFEEVPLGARAFQIEVTGAPYYLADYGRDRDWGGMAELFDEFLVDLEPRNWSAPDGAPSIITPALLILGSGVPAS